MGKNLIQFDKKPSNEIHVVPVDPTNYPFASAQLFGYWDTALLIGRPLGDDTNAARFIGECEDIIPIQPYGPVFDIGGGGFSPNNPRNVAVFKRYGLRDIVLKTGDDCNPYNPVYMYDNAPTVTTSPGSQSIGYISPDQPSVKSAAAGQTVRVIYHAKYPALPVN